jgi:hypothetical protein
MDLLNFKNKKVRVLYPLLLLVIPLIGMCITEEINWSPFDFILVLVQQTDPQIMAYIIIMIPMPMEI